MTSYTKKRIYFSLLLFFLTPFFYHFAAFDARAVSHGRAVRVRRVIDGDTIIIESGEHVRYIGINTPERGEAFFEEAREMNRALLKGGGVEIVECGGEKKDKYNRTLAWVYAGGALVNGDLLSRGLARLLIIPPCGVEKRALLERLAWQARSAGKGLWQAEGGAEKAPFVFPEKAERYIGRLVRVRGDLRQVRARGKTIFMELGHGDRQGLKLVIFSNALRAFKSAGIDPLGLLGSVVSVRGVVQRYKGRAEIILVDPGQVSVEGLHLK